MTRYVDRCTPPPVRLELTRLLSASLLQLRTQALHHTSIRLRMHLRYDVFTPLTITYANDSSGSMAPLTVPLMAFRRPIKASSNKLCTARSRYTEIPIWVRSRLMSATAREATRMRRLAWMAPEFRPGAFRSNLGGSWSVCLKARPSRSVSRSHVMARHHRHESVSLGDV
jgi:hypothetical protein